MNFKDTVKLFLESMEPVGIFQREKFKEKGNRILYGVLRNGFKNRELSLIMESFYKGRPTSLSTFLPIPPKDFARVFANMYNKENLVLKGHPDDFLTSYDKEGRVWLMEDKDNYLVLKSMPDDYEIKVCAWPSLGIPITAPEPWDDVEEKKNEAQRSSK